jgi:TatD DNase family protein
MILFDTHSHLDDEQFAGDRDGVLARAREAGVRSVIAVGTTADSSRICVALADRYDGVFASVGIQPNHCAEAADGDWERIVELAGRPGVVALGETGLDRYWDYAPIELQREYFCRHLQLSQQLGLPVIIHMRDASEDTVAVLRDARARGPIAGVLHSFTGDADAAAECLELGLYISFAGMVTFKKSAPLREVAAGVPEDRILIETDAPYLSPHPHRAQRPNEPALLVHTAACLAETRGVDLERFAAQTTENARRLFQLE